MGLSPVTSEKEVFAVTGEIDRIGHLVLWIFQYLWSGFLLWNLVNAPRKSIVTLGCAVETTIQDIGRGVLPLLRSISSLLV